MPRRDTERPAASRDELQRVAAFRAALRRLERMTEQAARAAGVTPRQYFLLLAVAGEPEGRGQITIGGLGAQLQLAQSTVSGLVDRVEAAGLVRRRAAAGDSRVVHVSLTPAGRRVLQQTMRRLDAERHRVAEAAEALLAHIDAAR